MSRFSWCLLLCLIWLGGCMPQPYTGKMDRYVLQYKLIDGSWTESDTVDLIPGGRVKAGTGGNAFTSHYEVYYVYDQPNSGFRTYKQLRTAAIDYKILSVNGVSRYVHPAQSHKGVTQ